MWVCAAPQQLVVAVYGVDGVDVRASLMADFGSVSVYRGERPVQTYLAIWGPRRAERFIAALRQVVRELEVIRRPPSVHFILAVHIRKPGLISNAS
jgi:hypothetical protein